MVPMLVAQLPKTRGLPKLLQHVCLCNVFIKNFSILTKCSHTGFRMSSYPISLELLLYSHVCLKMADMLF